MRSGRLTERSRIQRLPTGLGRARQRTRLVEFLIPCTFWQVETTIGRGQLEELIQLCKEELKLMPILKGTFRWNSAHDRNVVILSRLPSFNNEKCLTCHFLSRLIRSREALERHWGSPCHSKAPRARLQAAAPTPAPGGCPAPTAAPAPARSRSRRRAQEVMGRALLLSTSRALL